MNSNVELALPFAYRQSCLCLLLCSVSQVAWSCQKNPSSLYKWSTKHWNRLWNLPTISLNNEFLCLAETDCATMMIWKYGFDQLPFQMHKLNAIWANITYSFTAHLRLIMKSNSEKLSDLNEIKQWDDDKKKIQTQICHVLKELSYSATSQAQKRQTYFLCCFLLKWQHGK